MRSLAFIALAISVSAASADAATCYRLPFSNPTLSDGFGSLKGGRTTPHRGVDFPQPVGKAIPAVATGKVAVVTYTGCLGNVIVIKHADGKYSGYSHMNVRSSLKVGNNVSRGQTVGKVGKTGSCARGPHLHLTMSPAKGGYASGTVIDPYKWIKNHLCSSASVAAENSIETDDLADDENNLMLDEAAREQLEEDEMAHIISGIESDPLESSDEDEAPADDREEDATDDGEIQSGCSTSGSAAGLVVALGALALVRRRKR